jgi:hypothetical protein
MDPEIKSSRREPRLPCNPTSIHAQVEGSGRIVSGQIVEVSRAGIRLHVDEAVPVGSVVTVELGGTVLRGDVRHCEADDAERFTLGIQTSDVRHR